MLNSPPDSDDPLAGTRLVGLAALLLFLLLGLILGCVLGVVLV